MSGTTVLADGTKAYWTEGYSEVTILYADGRTESIDPHRESQHPVIAALDAAAELGLTPARPMTAMEEAEYAATRAAY